MEFIFYLILKLVIYSVICHLAMRKLLFKDGVLWHKAVGFGLLRMGLGLVLIVPSYVLVIWLGSLYGDWSREPILFPLRWLAWRLTLHIMLGRFSFGTLLLPRTSADWRWTLLATLSSSLLDAIQYWAWDMTKFDSKMGC